MCHLFGCFIKVTVYQYKPADNNCTTFTVHWTMDKEGKDLEQSSMSNNITIFRYIQIPKIDHERTVTYVFIYLAGLTSAI